MGNIIKVKLKQKVRSTLGINEILVEYNFGNMFSLFLKTKQKKTEKIEKLLK